MATKNETAKEEVLETADTMETPDMVEEEAVVGEEEKEISVKQEDFEKGKAEIKEEDPALTKDETSEGFMNEVLDADAFARRTINIPGKKKIRKAFAEEEEIVGDENGEIDTFAKLKKKEYDILVDSAKSRKPKVLFGRIDGIEEYTNGAATMLEVVCHLAASDRRDLNTEREITSNIYKIKIPVQMLAFSIPEEYFLPENYDSLRASISMRIQSIVEFVVYDIDPTEETVLASSVSAKQILQHEWYLGKRAKIKPGVKAKGHIVYINRKGVVVNVMGAETFIKNSELRWGFVSNPLDERSNFYIGKSVPVRILSVEKKSKEIIGRKFPYIQISASIKDAMPNPNEMFFDKYIEGSKYHGTIAYHLLNGNYIVKLGSDCKGLAGDGVMCLCKAPSISFGSAPYIGQEVSVGITGKDMKNHTISGAFTWMDQKIRY